MQILAIERLTSPDYEKKYKKYEQLNAQDIQKYNEEGVITAYWSRGDRLGNVLMLEVDSKYAAKELLELFTLVKQKVTTFALLPLEPYQVEALLPEKEKKNFVLVFASATVGEEATKSILKDREHLQKRNNQLGITGILLYENGSFFQVLEGNEKIVNTTYKRILKDSRHENIIKVATFYTNEKQFSEYDTGYASIKTKDLEEIEGFENFFQKNSFLEIKENQLTSLLTAFRSGRWRQ